MSFRGGAQYRADTRGWNGTAWTQW
jgi:hypothetical protein